MNEVIMDEDKNNYMTSLRKIAKSVKNKTTSMVYHGKIRNY